MDPVTGGDDLNGSLSGAGPAVRDGVGEPPRPGVTPNCPGDSPRGIVQTSGGDRETLAIVAAR